MNTIAINHSSIVSNNLEGSILGRLIASLFEDKNVAVSTPAIGEGLTEEVLEVNKKKDLDAHLIITTEVIDEKVSGATIVHPSLLPKLIREMAGPEKEKIARQAVLFWNFDELEPSYMAVPHISIENGKVVAHADSYAPGVSDTVESMKVRMANLCKLYGHNGIDPRKVPEFALARQQLSYSEVSTFGNMFARSVNTQHAIFETLRLIYLCGQNAVVYHDKGTVRKWFIKEHRRYSGCIPKAIVEGYKGRGCSQKELSNGVIEMITPIPVNM